MKKNINGFSIALAMGLVILINIIALSIMEYIIPFSKNTKGIENSLVAYYQANSGIESALFNMKGEEAGYESYGSGGTSFTYNNYDIEARGSVLPPVGEGNSEYDSNWNQISMGSPIQLEIGNSYLGSDLDIAFRVPDLNDSNSTLTLSGGSDLPIVNWQLSSNTNTLNSSGSQIFPNKGLYSKICSSDEIYNDCKLSLFNTYFSGVDLNGNEEEIGDFYNSNCNGSGCILKLSIINNLETNTGISIPYLEWRIDIGSSNMPLRYTKISTQGKAYGYRKDLEIKIPQQTTNEAFDFTVFQ